MKIDRKYTNKDQDVFSSVEWIERTSRISQPDGSVIFEMKDARIPAQWSQLATDIMVSKYFRKAGVPQHDAEGNMITREDGSIVTGPEHSAKQVIHRMAGCWRHWGESHGYFDTREDANTFYDEISYMLLHQIAAPNSPQWFNTGLNWAYNLTGPAQGHYIVDPATGEIQKAHDAYTHPQPHACFIQSISDDLVNPGGIMDLWVREARLFKYGSGTGTNFSQLRGNGEALSGGGSSSGLMSWLKIGDRAAAAIKSGGTTRRAAKMVCLDVDHPDVEEFINWKVREEIKVAAMVEGFKALPKDQQILADNLGLNLDYDFNGEAYFTVSGQNSNNSIRIPDEFFETLDNNGDWELLNRTDGSIAKSIPANDLWQQICYAAWRCADPGLQFDSTINAWHTCPDSGRINASNPCSEYMFLDNTACNLASINLMKFYDKENRTFDLDGFEHAIRLWTIVLEISVLMAAFPSAEIAILSHDFRTLGLGYANLGAMLMCMGVPYDSDNARTLCSIISAILTGKAYAVSAEIGRELGPFKGFSKNRESMLRVIRNHRRAVHGVDRQSGKYEGLKIAPLPINNQAVLKLKDSLPDAVNLHNRVMDIWDKALDMGEKHGYRNAQVSVIAPTGTIGLLMDCDTTGVEPDFALVKFKKLAGGGYFKIANNSLKPAITSLGYSEKEIDAIITYVLGTLHLDTPVPDAKGTLADFLKAKGFTTQDLDDIEVKLPAVFELSAVFNPNMLSDELLKNIGIKNIKKTRSNYKFDLLLELGLNKKQIEKLNELICGTQTVEGAPYLREEHLKIFDCANPCGKNGKRFIAPNGHIKMMAAAQPFISGAISKTINLPSQATITDIGKAYRLSWELGLKANALYRDGCKLSQPLNTASDNHKLLSEDDDIDDINAAKAEVIKEVRELAEAVVSTTPNKTTKNTVADENNKKELNNPQATAETGKIRTVEKIVERIVERPLRKRLPDTRKSLTHKFSVAGHEGYLTVGLYPEGMPGELFITMSKEGSTIGGLMDSLGTAISVALQYGVPLESLVGKFSYQRFEPAGITGNREIPFAKSLVDYIFRWLGIQFIPGYKQQHSPSTIISSTPETKTPITKSAGTVNDNIVDDLSEITDVVARNRLKNIPQDTSTGDTKQENQTKNEANLNIGVDDPSVVRDVVARKSTLAKLQTDVQTVAAIADKENAQASAVVEHSLGGSLLDKALSGMMGDAPPCDRCGSISVRNGSCYRCLNCGNSMGCS